MNSSKTININLRLIKYGVKKEKKQKSCSNMDQLQKGN